MLKNRRPLLLTSGVSKIGWVAPAAERKRKDDEERLRRERKEKEIADHIRLGNEAFGNELFDEAIDHFSKAIALDSERSSSASSSNEVREQLALAGKRANEPVNQSTNRMNPIDAIDLFRSVVRFSLTFCRSLISSFCRTTKRGSATEEGSGKCEAMVR